MKGVMNAEQVDLEVILLASPISSTTEPNNYSIAKKKRGHFMYRVQFTYTEHCWKLVVLKGMPELCPFTLTHCVRDRMLSA